MNAVSSSWVRPALKKMGLLDCQTAPGDLSNFRRELEKSKLVDEVRETVSQINNEAKYQVLELVEFLPPARSVARVGFSRDKADHFLEIVVRDSGPKVVFYTFKKVRVGFPYLFGGDPAAPNCKVKFSQPFRPDATTPGDLQDWFVYLISGFKDEFKPITRIAAA